MNDNTHSTGTEIQEIGGNPLGVSEFVQDTDPLTASTTGRTVNSGALLIVIVVVVAVAALFSMKTIARLSAETPKAGKFEEIIDKFLDTFGDTTTVNGGIVTSSTALEDPAIIEVLSDDYTEMQVPTENVQFNPFIIAGDDEVVDNTPITPVNTGETRMERLQNERRTVMELAKSKLTLQSVMMMGDDPLASINGNIIHEGDIVEMDGVEFEVQGISLDSVSLMAVDEAMQINFPVMLFLRRD